MHVLHELDILDTGNRPELTSQNLAAHSLRFPLASFLSRSRHLSISNHRSPPTAPARAGSLTPHALPFHGTPAAAEAAFDHIAKMGKQMFRVPISLVTLVDHSRQWFKSCYGLNVSQTGRDVAFCAHAIMPEAPDVFEVPDAELDPRFCDNPLVTGDPHIRYYAGAPLIVNLAPDTGPQKMGTLCIIDTKPRPPMDLEERDALKNLAAMVVDQLTSRLQSKRLVQINGELVRRTAEVNAINQELTALIDTANAPIFAVDSHMRVTAWNRKISEITSIAREEIDGRDISRLVSVRRDDEPSADDSFKKNATAAPTAAAPTAAKPDPHAKHARGGSREGSREGSFKKAPESGTSSDVLGASHDSLASVGSDAGSFHSTEADAGSFRGAHGGVGAASSALASDPLSSLTSVLSGDGDAPILRVLRQALRGERCACFDLEMRSKVRGASSLSEPPASPPASALLPQPPSLRNIPSARTRRARSARVAGARAPHPAPGLRRTQARLVRQGRRRRLRRRGRRAAQEDA